ncbi:MAG: hypothetical protein EOP20_02170 [Hyphomicrobiales bacterium]|nr:MAG: hypothetical protein EOP20_02170 [Hyphomicrobiales bacterium]
MPQNQLRSALRAHTADSHGRLDRAVGLFDAIVPYKAYLQHTHVFRETMEAELAGFDGWSIVSLSALANQDLADLDTPRLSARPFSGDDDRHGYKLGMAYVLEGSGLGSRILVKRAAELGFGPSFGARHLAMQTDDPTRWRGFLAVLDTVPEPQFDSVLAGAEQCFQFALSIYTESR